MPSSRELLLARIAEWSTDASRASRSRLEPELVHKSRPDNVALARLDTYDPDHLDDRCVAEVFVDTDHAYFFEHPIDHVPGLLLIEAARQVGVAAAHQFLGVPLHAAMLVDELHVKFHTYAELDAPLFIALEAHDKSYRKERFVGARLTAEFIQGGETVGEIWLRARLVWWVR